MPDSFKIGFQFHNDSKKTNSYTLTRDGGGHPNSRGRAVQAYALMQNTSWLKDISMEPDPRLRRFEPTLDSLNSQWVISIRPSFEHHVTKGKKIPSDVSGIYRYKLGQETVYIGRGKVKSRSKDLDRENWTFDVIEYSIISNEIEQKKWESDWLNIYRELHNGELPLYNRIGGKRSAAIPEARRR